MDMEQLAQIFEAVKVMPLHDNDILVLRTPHTLSEEAINRFRSYLTDAFGPDRKVLVLTDGADIDVIRVELA